MDIQKLTKSFVKEQAKKNEKAHTECPLGEFPRHCYGGIFHIPVDLRNGWENNKGCCVDAIFGLRPKLGIGLLTNE